MRDEDDGGVLLLMPTTASTAAGPVSVWITAAGWAQATAEVNGRSWLRTPAGVLDPDDARALASLPSSSRRRPTWRRLVPTVVGTARKDVRQWFSARRFRDAGLDGPWSEVGLDYVWQHHELFHDSGFVAARAFGCPTVLFVDAPIVWEAEQWDVRRPGWARAAERIGEKRQLREADIVACVSERVAEQVIDMGASESSVIVTPCATDLDRFRPLDGSAARRELGLDDRFVVGWLGTFHRFHGLDLLLDAFQIVSAAVSDATLLLVGDGLDRRRVQERADSMGLDVRFTGTVAHEQVPEILACMDVATIVDPGTKDFHYSPLKLKEYLASGLAVVAPDSGEVGTRLASGEHALLVPAGDPRAVADAVVSLAEDDVGRRSIGAAARRLMELEGSWRTQAERVQTMLDDR